jgi:hypothetical protein
MQESFFTLGVSLRVVRVLERRGITAPFAVQQLVLPDALAGLDVLAASPTGSGKDTRIRDPAHRADRRGSRRDGRARTGADARARLTGRRGARAAHRRPQR